MTNIPNKIYLQIGEEPEIGYDFKELEGVTFNTDEIFKNDLAYYSQSEVKALIKKHLDLAAENVREPYKKSGMTNLSERAYKSITDIKIELT